MLFTCGRGQPALTRSRRRRIWDQIASLFGFYPWICLHRKLDWTKNHESVLCFIVSAASVTCTSAVLLLYLVSRIADDTARRHGAIRNEHPIWFILSIVSGTVSLFSISRCLPRTHEGRLRICEALLVTLIAVATEIAFAVALSPHRHR